MLKYLFILLLFSATIVAQAELTAEDAIRLGLKNNYNIRISRNNAEIAKNNTGLGMAEFLPGVNATGGYTRAKSDQETNNPFTSGGTSNTRTWNGQIALNWTLFDGFSMFASNRQFREFAELGEAQARNQIEITVVGILSAYFNLVQQAQLLQVQREALEISRTRLEKEKIRREVGGASSTDLLNAQVSFNNDQSNLLNQELNVLTARKTLNILLAQDPATPLTVSNEIVIPDLLLPFEDLLKLAEKRNSVLQSVEINRRISAQSIQIARSSFLPRLSLNATYGYNNRSTDVGVKPPNFPDFPDELVTKTTDGSVGLSLSWNLFNGFRNKIDWQNARIQAKNQQLALENARNELAGLLNEKYETFLKRLELVKLEQQNVLAARQNLALQQERLQLGSSTSLEFRDAQINLTRAQTALIVARYLARITRLEIEQLTGRLAVD